MAAASLRADGPAPRTEPAPASGPVPGEAGLEARLIAPCCWTQTLDVHASSLSQDLRREIRARLIAGEAPGAIEESLVDRYGERIRAMPRGQEVRVPVVGLLMLLAAAAVAVVLWRWIRASAVRAAASPGPTGAPPARDAYDERIDEELRALDD